MLKSGFLQRACIIFYQVFFNNNYWKSEQCSKSDFFKRQLIKKIFYIQTSGEGHINVFTYELKCCQKMHIHVHVFFDFSSNFKECFWNDSEHFVSSMLSVLLKSHCMTCILLHQPHLYTFQNVHSRGIYLFNFFIFFIIMCNLLPRVQYMPIFFYSY